ncbi:MAG: hypothetical protein ACK48S_12855 [Planctomycetia bacterium]|jgi:hypothetical protein
MLQIIEVEGGYRSIVSCDVCLEPITDARMAVAVRFSHGSVWHLHKNKCHDRAERMVPAFRRGFMELREHIDQIGHNTRRPASTAGEAEG